MKNDPVNIHQAEIPGWYVTFNRENGVSHSEQFTEEKHALIYAKQKRTEVEQRHMRDELNKARLRTDDTASNQKSQLPRQIISGFEDSANLRKFENEGSLEAKEILQDKTRWQEITNTENRIRYVHGLGGGVLLFVPSEDVEVFWNYNAALAGEYASGRRKNPIVKSGKVSVKGGKVSGKVSGKGGKGSPPELDELFSCVATVRNSGMRGTNYPLFLKEPDAITRLKSYPALTWRMLRAVALGNYQELEAIAQHLKKYEELQKQGIGLSPWQDIADAIQEAAINKKGVPQRKDVYAAYADRKKKNPEKNNLNDPLVRMGFGWLPASPIRGKGKQKG